jgi:hypothetical protein
VQGNIVKEAIVTPIGILNLETLTGGGTPSEEPSLVPLERGGKCLLQDQDAIDR